MCEKALKTCMELTESHYKGWPGLVGLIDSESSLRRWTTAGLGQQGAEWEHSSFFARVGLGHGKWNDIETA